MTVLEGSSVMVTGGTGSFGKAFIRHVLTKEDPRRVVIFSRDELKQYEMRDEFVNDDRLRWFLGDIRDADRLRRAMDEHGTTILGAASTGNRRTRCPRHHGLLHHCPALLRRHFRRWFNAVLTATLQTEGIKNEKLCHRQCGTYCYR